jgi:hypothetical protein
MAVDLKLHWICHIFIDHHLNASPWRWFGDGWRLWRYHLHEKERIAWRSTRIIEMLNPNQLAPLLLCQKQNDTLIPDLN